MSFRKITAIVRPDVLEHVERRLQELCVPGVSVTKVKGYGEYADFYRPDWMVTHIRLEVFVATSQAQAVAEAIVETAHTGLPGDGIVAVAPVEALYHIRTRTRCENEACP